MDKLASHQEIIKAILEGYTSQYSGIGAGKSGLETSVLMDDTRGAYLVLRHGWQGKERVQRVLVFLRLVQGKIWVEEDWTDYDFAGRLLQAGVPEEDIVLAFHHPALRQHADLATP